MNKIFTSQLLCALLTLLLSVVSMPALAQDIEVVGYTNVWVHLESAPDAGGQVCATVTEKGLKTWKASIDFNQTVQVASLLGSNITMFYAFARPAAGYTFAGWYEDADGDGKLNIANDVLLDTAEEFIVVGEVPEGAGVYATQAEAKSGSKPTVAQSTIFAYFTRGATIGITDYQGDGMNGVNCGSIYVDKPINEPGDVVTVRALPSDGYQFEYWQSKSMHGDVVSRENPYQFTVQGGEQLYAYFTAIDAPQVELPAEGGFAVLNVNGPWVMHNDAVAAGAHILVMEQEDLTRTADGKTYLDMSKDECMIDIGQANSFPTIVYGKGTVRFAFKMSYGYARKQDSERLVRWSGNRGTTVKGENLYIYAFRPDLGAFVTIGNTDMMVNPDVSTTFSVPAQLAYFSMSAFDLVDNEGNIPAVIGLSPETYDRAVAGISELPYSDRNAQFSALKSETLYDLQGRRVQRQLGKGLYITGRRKVLAK